MVQKLNISMRHVQTYVCKVMNPGFQYFLCNEEFQHPSSTKSFLSFRRDVLSSYSQKQQFSLIKQISSTSSGCSCCFGCSVVKLHVLLDISDSHMVHHKILKSNVQKLKNTVKTKLIMLKKPHIYFKGHKQKHVPYLTSCRKKPPEKMQIPTNS